MGDDDEGLEPCPFCGSADVDIRQIFGKWFAHCVICCTESGAFSSQEEAFEAWNRRAIDADALREVVDELECAYRPKDYASVDALCELSNAASKALAKRIRKAVGDEVQG